MKKLLLVALTMALLSCTQHEPNKLIRLSSLFSDHMVLQQKDTMLLQGETKAGGNIKVTTGWGGTGEVTAGPDGKWKIDVATPEAGGPYSIEISTGDTTRVVRDVYIGEVWLASGQSNMEMPLEGWLPGDTVNNSAKEIADANYPQIRMFTVEKAVSDSLMKDVNGSWQICSPATAPAFSASAYFFARKLNKELGVPIGIVHSSWGGTPAEAWVSRKSLEALGDFNDVLTKINVSPEEQKRIMAWSNRLETKEVSSSTEIPSIDVGDAVIAKEDFDDSAWSTMELPRLWESSAVGEFDGIVWFRKEIILDDEPSGEYKLSLGPIDDMDATYVNGMEVGSLLKEGFWQTNRTYTIPDGTLKKGKNSIAIKVIDPRGGGGVWGTPDQMYLESSKGKISLAGEWKYLPVAEYRNGKLYVYGVENSAYAERPKSLALLSPYTPTMLYNAMINPLIHYTFKGVIWYQGESNVGRAEQYERLFPALINDWREQMGRDLPFYFVQIAPYTYTGGQATKSAALRDAQRKTLSLAGTGMVVTMDIGSARTIHPGNKQAVGERLANWALANTYEKPVAFSGPLFKNIEVNGSKVTVTFDHAEGLKQKGEKLTGFEIAGTDGKFYKADAKIDQDKVIVSSPQVKTPVTIRYAWGDTDEATLFNEAGLPASSFSASR